MARAIIEVNGCRVDTDKVSDDIYERALEAGLYALIITGELDINTILAPPEIKDNVITLTRRTLTKIETEN